MNNNESSKLSRIKQYFFGGWHWWDFVLLLVLEGALIGLGLWAKSPWYVLIASTFNVAAGLFNIKANKLYFVLGGVYTGFYLYIAFEAENYGEFVFAIISLLLAIRTVWQWAHAKDVQQSGYEIRRIHPLALCAWTIPAAAVLVAYGFVLQALGSNLPFLNATCTVVSASAYLLTVRRVKEQWIVWLGNNVAYISLWAVTIAQQIRLGTADPWANIPLVAQSGIYVILNIWGLISWTRMVKQRTVPQEPADLPQDDTAQD